MHDHYSDFGPTLAAEKLRERHGISVSVETLQDRLIKEMRLEGISSIEDANAWLNIFIADFNRRFAKAANDPKDLHRPVAESVEDLDDIFAWQESRKLSRSLTFRYDKMIYLFEPIEEKSRIAGENMVAGPPESAVGNRLQTTSGCCSKELW